MKPITIDFVPHRRWLLVWVPACLVIGLASGAMFMKARTLADATRQIDERRMLLAKETAAARAAGEKARAAQAADPRAAQLRAVDKMLRQDWNPAFATIENVQLPGARLLQFSIDAQSEAVRVEYEVDSLAQATALTASMNSGLREAAWRLEGVSATSTGMGGPSDKMRATWVARLGMLR